MSDKKQKEQESSKKQTAEIVEKIHETEEFVKRNKNTLIYVLGGIALVVVAYFGYGEFITKPNNARAAEEMFSAENNFAKDSFRLALKGNGPILGFETIAEDYGSTPSGNLANFYAGVCCLRLGEYEQAIEYFENFKTNDEIFAPRKLANIGDCYTELGDLDNAAKYFVQAARAKDNTLTPSYLMKACAVYEKQGNYAGSLKLYREIKSKYPQSNEASAIDKYIERAQILSEN